MKSNRDRSKSRDLWEDWIYIRREQWRVSHPSGKRYSASGPTDATVLLIFFLRIRGCDPSRTRGFTFCGHPVNCTIVRLLFRYISRTCYPLWARIVGRLMRTYCNLVAALVSLAKLNFPSPHSSPTCFTTCSSSSLFNPLQNLSFNFYPVISC